MELVIKIPNETYQDVVKNGFIYDEDGEVISHAIINGTPLPKGHGRLIDADKLWDSYHDLDYDFYEAFDMADTIIEADKAERSEE
jgi:hypothetical protein